MTGGADDPDQARILKIIRIFRMVKILRMVRIQRLLKKLQDDMGIKNGVMISVKFAMFTCFAAHFQACLWFLMSSSHPGNNWALGYCIKADAVNNDAGCGDTCGVVTCRERIFQLNETAAADPARAQLLANLCACHSELLQHDDVVATATQAQILIYKLIIKLL